MDADTLDLIRTHMYNQVSSSSDEEMAVEICVPSLSSSCAHFLHRLSYCDYELFQTSNRCLVPTVRWGRCLFEGTLWDVPDTWSMIWYGHTHPLSFFPTRVEAPPSRRDTACFEWLAKDSNGKVLGFVVDGLGVWIFRDPSTGGVDRLYDRHLFASSP